MKHLHKGRPALPHDIRYFFRIVFRFFVRTKYENTTKHKNWFTNLFVIGNINLVTDLIQRNRVARQHGVTSAHIGNMDYIWTRLKFATCSASQSLEQQIQIVRVREMYHDKTFNMKRIYRSSFKHQIAIGQKLVWTECRHRRCQDQRQQQYVSLHGRWNLCNPSRKHGHLADHSWSSIHKAKHHSHKICARISYNLLSINNIQHCMKYNVGFDVHFFSFP